MRIVVHDFPGHAFPVQLSRALASRGHQVLHLHFAQFQAPKGALAPRPDDPPGLTLEALDIDGAYAKYDFVKRALQDRAYGKVLARRVATFKPDVVLGGNAPLDPQAALQRWCRKHGVGFLFWLQDVYGLAIALLLRRRLPLVGGLVGWHFQALERRLWRRSDRIVAITEDFRPILSEHGVDQSDVSIIENWAVLEDMHERPRDNDFARAHDLVGKKVVMYSGTLGLKHDPDLLVTLAEAARDRPDVRVVVASEGIGRNHLLAAKESRNLDNLILLPFQPYEAVPDMMGSADVLVVLLERDAGIYSVPSKTLAYLCAGRAVLAAVPVDNQASLMIGRIGAGQVVNPDDRPGFAKAALALLDDDATRLAMGKKARAYAEKTFDIARIAERFEAELDAARTRGAKSRPS